MVYPSSYGLRFALVMRVTQDAGRLIEVPAELLQNANRTVSASVIYEYNAGPVASCYKAPESFDVESVCFVIARNDKASRAIRDAALSSMHQRSVYERAAIIQLLAPGGGESSIAFQIAEKSQHTAGPSASAR